MHCSYCCCCGDCSLYGQKQKTRKILLRMRLSELCNEGLLSQRKVSENAYVWNRRRRLRTACLPRKLLRSSAVDSENCRSPMIQLNILNVYTGGRQNADRFTDSVVPACFSVGILKASFPCFYGKYR